EDIISGKVKTVALEGLVSTETIRSLGKAKGDRPFITARVQDPDLVQELEKVGVKFTGRIENKIVKFFTNWILPMLFFILVWGFLMKRMGGAGGGLLSIGKSKAKVFMEKDISIRFDDVAGIDEAKEELKEIIEFLRNPQKFQRLGGKIPKGVMLVGAPGTGKTMLAKAVAGEANVPFFSLSGSDFVEMFVGVGAARVRDLFLQAQEKAPCIIFIDELDALGKARGINPMGGHDEREQTLNQLLVEMDGFNTEKGVIIMAATNRPEILDPALLRPGRFDRHVMLDKPDVTGREAILKVHVKGVTLAPGVDLKTIAARTPGFVGADLANIVNEAALLAARKDKQQVDMEDFDEAIDRVVAGLEKKNRRMNEKEKEIVAYHESGHAIVAEVLPNADPVHKVSIIPRGVAALGYTQQLPTEDRYLMTKSELLDKMSVLFGGRLAEEIIFKEISTGAQNDLLRATDIAERMVREFGMSDLGLVTFEKERRPLFLETGMGFDTGRQVSQETARAIDQEVSKIIELARSTAAQILEGHQEQLKILAGRLLEKEVVEGEELREMLKEQGGQE
ncbi:MAG: ATP-dependent zinc metalloprotease FtsH, partial [Deltaproteobacteria bacterium]|nr:ATP-dependent zinc metalloprotease FtsH [Deltaproteobacteria bacterium]